MRRNDVVQLKNNPCFYGRIVRIIDDKALWICSGLHIHLTQISNLEIQDYKGYYEWTNQDDGLIHYYEKDDEGFLDFGRIKFKRPRHFIKMTSLRKLKQLTSRYAKHNAWKTPLDYEFLIKDE